MKYILPIVAIITALITFLYLKPSGPQKSDATPEEKIISIFNDEKPPYIDRYNNGQSEARNVAISHYKNDDFKKAGETFAQIELNQRTVYDNFYQAYSQLRSNQNMDAMIGFGKVIRDSKAEDNIYQQAKLYQILCLVSLKDHKRAKDFFDQLPEGSKAKNKLQPIIQRLDQVSK